MNSKLTYNNIISLLQRDGINSKEKVLNLLKNSSVNDLKYLRNSIQEEINIREGVRKENGKKNC